MAPTPVNAGARCLAKAGGRAPVTGNVRRTDERGIEHELGAPRMTDEPTLKEPPAEWEQFRELIELHKFYFANIIKGATFAFGIVGAVVSYVITSSIRDSPGVWIALAIPILLSFSTSFVALLGAIKTYDLSAQVQTMQSKLKLAWRPHSEILPWITGVFAVLFFAAAVGLVVLAVDPSRLPAVAESRNK
jgi:hypothetical protein